MDFSLEQFCDELISRLNVEEIWLTDQVEKLLRFSAVGLSKSYVASHWYGVHQGLPEDIRGPRINAYRVAALLLKDLIPSLNSKCLEQATTNKAECNETLKAISSVTKTFQACVDVIMDATTPENTQMTNAQRNALIGKALTNYLNITCAENKSSTLADIQEASTRCATLCRIMFDSSISFDAQQLPRESIDNIYSTYLMYTAENENLSGDEKAYWELVACYINRVWSINSQVEVSAATNLLSMVDWYNWYTQSTDKQALIAFIKNQVCVVDGVVDRMFSDLIAGKIVHQDEISNTVFASVQTLAASDNFMLPEEQKPEVNGETLTPSEDGVHVPENISQVLLTLAHDYVTPLVETSVTVPEATWMTSKMFDLLSMAAGSNDGALDDLKTLRSSYLDTFTATPRGITLLGFLYSTLSGIIQGAEGTPSLPRIISLLTTFYNSKHALVFITRAN